MLPGFFLVKHEGAADGCNNTTMMKLDYYLGY